MTSGEAAAIKGFPLRSAAASMTHEANLQMFVQGFTQYKKAAIHWIHPMPAVRGWRIQKLSSSELLICPTHLYGVRYYFEKGHGTYPFDTLPDMACQTVWLQTLLQLFVDVNCLVSITLHNPAEENIFGNRGLGKAS